MTQIDRRFGFWMLAMIGGMTPAVDATEVVGDQVQVEWAPAEGPVAGYYLIVSRDGAPPEVEGISLVPSGTVHGKTGEQMVVQVAAFNEAGEAGPVSDPSEMIQFVPPPPAPEPDPEPTPEPDPEPTPEPDPEPTPEPDPEPTPEPEPTPVPDRRARMDLTCDGVSDLVVKESALRYAIWQMNGAQREARIQLPSANANHALVGAGDYDGDGCADLLWQDRYTHQLTVWLLEGGVRVSSHHLRDAALPTGEDWRVAGSGDVDGDGRDDIVRYSRIAGELEVWLMDGGIVDETVRLPGRRGAWSVPGLIDGDGDGRVEVLWYDEIGRQLEHLDPITGMHTPLWQMLSGWLARGAADHDADGFDEILAIAPAVGGSALLNPEGPGAFVDMLDDSTGLGRVVGRGDYDADGGEDIAWLDADSGVVTLWLEAGSRELPLEKKLPRGASVEAAAGSDESSFRRLLCEADVDGNGILDTRDRDKVQSCLDGTTLRCGGTDLDGDGGLTLEDLRIVDLRLSGEHCAANSF